MKKLAEKIKQATLGKKPAPVAATVEHPNFWMYQ